MNDTSHDPALALRQLCRQVLEEAPRARVPQPPVSPARQKARLIAAEILKRQAQKRKGE